MQESFSFLINSFGGLILPAVKTCLLDLLNYALSEDKIFHFSYLVQIAYSLGLLFELSSSCIAIKSKFSTLSCLNIFETLVSTKDFNLIFLKEMMKIAENPTHSFKNLAIICIEKTFKYFKTQENVILDLILDWKFNTCSPTLFFPYAAELQCISLGEESKIDSPMRLYSNLFLQLSSKGGGLIDLFIILLSELIEKARINHNSNAFRTYEYCFDRILYLSKCIPSSLVTVYSELYLTIPSETGNWDKIMKTISDIGEPQSFSEWIFITFTNCCNFTKSQDSELIQSLLPIMIEPLGALPVLPICILTAHYSNGGLFFKETFKPSFLSFLEIESNVSSVIETTLDIVSETFDVFTKYCEISGVDAPEILNWLSQFSIPELVFLYRVSVKLEILRYMEFFMQLIWSLDSKKLSNAEIYQSFSKLGDFNSALNVNSNDNNFSTERALYYFMSSNQHSLADAAISSLNSTNSLESNYLLIKNASQMMDRERFLHSYDKILRSSPDSITSFSLIRSNLKFPQYFGSGVGKSFQMKYEIESDVSFTKDCSYPKNSSVDNFTLLQESKYLRKNKDFESAYYMLSKMKFENDSFWNFKHFMELGNWFHASGKYSVSIEIFQSLSKDQKNPKLLSKIYRKLAVSMVSSRHFSDQEIIDAFEKSSNLDKSCAKISFEIGSFYDSKLNTNQDRAPIVLKNYARALLNSRKYDHLIYPRFITIWLSVPISAPLDKKVAELIAKFIQVSSTSQAVNHLSQLISRIGHPKPADAMLLEQFLIKIFSDFSDVSLWKMASVANSNNEVRKSRIRNIFSKVSVNIKNFDIKLFLEFCKLLVEICELSPGTDAIKISLSKELRACRRIIASNILIAAPNSTLIYSPENKEGYDYIRGFEDHCLALPSLQRPKKIKFVLNSSKYMIALLKPKDDLRKDCRFMELCRFLNLSFKKQNEANEIKIYAVTPLNDECGVIEWVEHTTSFRGILLRFYKRSGVSIALRDLKEILAMQISPYEKFTKFFLPKFPPIFMRWFFEKFPSTQKWKDANKSYTKSLAVMSMVGFIMGLGDRHGENILFDETSGMCVHVDFNCLFEKGKTLEYPEKVPFRLTQNLEHACGAGGIHSKFKNVSSSIMNLMWDSKRSILTNLETFLHDPLVEWSKSKKITNQNSDITNEQVSKILKLVERKLSGFIEMENFSCEGQVEKLIQHATDKKNLSEMYIGWSAFL